MCNSLYRQSDERSNELAKAVADAEETISKLKSQAAIKLVQDNAVSEAAGEIIRCVLCCSSFISIYLYAYLVWLLKRLVC